MDTRSVIRSRRHSARLHQQLHDDKAVKQSVPNRRVSDTGVSSTRKKATTSKSAIPKAVTKKGAHSAADPAPERASEPSNTIDTLTKDVIHVADSPVIPIMASSKIARYIAKTHEAQFGTAETSEDLDTETRGSPVRARWVKTVEGAVRLVDDSPHNSLPGVTVQLEETPNGEPSSVSNNRRRSARLAGSTLGAEGMTMPVTNVRQQPSESATTEKKAVPPIDKKKGLDPQRDLRRVSLSDSSDSSDSGLTDPDELPPYNNLSFAYNPTEEADFVEKTSPIPELVADIARIIETSSPITSRALDTNSRHTSNTATAIDSLAGETAPTTTTAVAPKSAGVSDIPNEASTEDNYTLSSIQSATANQSPLGFASGENTDDMVVAQTLENNAALAHVMASDTVAEDNREVDNLRGLKRSAEEMSPDAQTPVRNSQHVGSSSRPFSFTTPTRTTNLIESARSRDNYDMEDSELGSPAAGLWLDGDSSAAAPGRASEVQEEEPHLQDITKCGDCGKTHKKFIVCVKCMRTRYCGKYCQTWNWPVHRQSCHAAEEASPDEVKRQEEYLQGMWDGACGMLKEHAAGRNTETVGGDGEQADTRATVGSSSMDHRADEPTVEDEVGLEERGMGSDERAGGSVMAEHVGDGFQDEEVFNFKMPPSTPESMFQSRARALRLAQAEDV